MRVTLRTLLVAIALATTCHSHAVAAVILTGTNYSEDFNEPGLSSTAQVGHWSSVGVQRSIPGVSGWDGVRIAGTGSSMHYQVQTGANPTGSLVSYGDVLSTERALGSLASNSTTPAFGVELNNAIGAEITQVAVSYTGEFWKIGTSAPGLLTFGYSVGSPGSATYLTDAATGVGALNLVGPPANASGSPLDGNLPVNQATYMATIDVSVPVGQSLYLRWQDTNDAGNDAALAIDNFQLSAVTVPEPAALVMLFIAAAGISTFRPRY